MEKLSDLLEMAKVSDIIATKKEKEDNKIVWALAIIGAIAAVAGIAFAVYKYLTPDYMDDFDEDFDDDFDDDFFDEEAEEEDEEWGQKRGRVDAVWSRQRVHLGDNLVRFYKFAVFQLDRRVVLFVRLSQGVVALVAVEQLLQHRCIVCYNPAGQRKDALGLEDVLAHLLVVDLHLDHVRTGL